MRRTTWTALHELGIFDPDSTWNGVGPKANDAEDTTTCGSGDQNDHSPDRSVKIPCYMCVPVEYRFDAEKAAEAGYPWPLRRVVRTRVVGRAELIETYTLECEHTII